MSKGIFTVLFLCTGNSARSIMAEAIMNHYGRGRVQAYSAGSHPKSAVHPLAIATMQDMGLSVEGLHSKSWEEFARADAPGLDCLLTVCDDAAGEVCPLWPGKPVTAHWGVEDPAAYAGTEAAQRAKFREVAFILHRRIERLLGLPLTHLDAMTLQAQLHDIEQE